MVVIHSFPTRHLLAIALLAGCNADAIAAGPATPATLDAKLRQARDGDTIKLTPGDYGVVTFPGKRYSPALRIEAAGATFTGIVLPKTDGVAIMGGTVVGPGGRSYGISLRNAQNIRIEGMRITGAHRGIVISESSDVAVVNNTLTDLISDGINIALSHKVLIQGNSCSNFHPKVATFDANGARLEDGDHPDCIQAWSRPSAPPSADLTIEDNTIEGQMQGIFLGNNRNRNGQNDGGYDRLIVRNNHIRVGYPHGLTVAGARNAIISGNVVDTVAGARLPGKPDHMVRANLNIIDSTDVTACGNSVSAVAKAPGQGRCGKTQDR